MDYLEDKKLLELRFSNGMMILPFVRYKLLVFLTVYGIISVNTGLANCDTIIHPLVEIQCLNLLFFLDYLVI